MRENLSCCRFFRVVDIHIVNFIWAIQRLAWSISSKVWHAFLHPSSVYHPLCLYSAADDTIDSSWRHNTTQQMRREQMKSKIFLVKYHFYSRPYQRPVLRKIAKSFARGKRRIMADSVILLLIRSHGSIETCYILFSGTYPLPVFTNRSMSTWIRDEVFQALQVHIRFRKFPATLVGWFP